MTTLTEKHNKASPGGTPTWVAELLHAPRTSRVHIEFTTRCTLRCVYCPISQPGYQGTDFDRAQLDKLIQGLRQRRTRTIVINGVGETTMVTGWVDVARQLLDSGFRLRIISNLARELTEDEVATLARFDELRVSCDTVDADLFRRLRRAANLETVWSNQERVRQHAARLRMRGPKLVWSAVVCDRTVLGLPALVAAGMARGVRQFTLCNLVKCADIPGALAVAHVSTLDREHAIQARDAINQASQLARAHGRACMVQAGLLESLEEHIASPDEPNVASPQNGAAASEPVTNDSPPGTAPAPATTTYSQAVPAGCTRLCVDPWNFGFVAANGDVRPCCLRADAIGNVLTDKSLQEIFNNRQAQQLRRELLMGELAAPCAACPAREVVPLQKQRAAVQALLAREGAIRGPRGWIYRARALVG